MAIHLVEPLITCSAGVRRFKAGLDLNLVATKMAETGSDNGCSVPLLLNPPVAEACEAAPARLAWGVAPGGLPELGLGMGHGVAYANVQDEQHPAGCACCMAHGGAGGAPSASDRPKAPEGRSG
jgi:hypothetical protein